MANLSEHSRHTLKRYGVTGESIHRWMDEPSQIDGEHRRFRHEVNTEIPREYIKEFGEELSRNILLDHIDLDKHTVSESKRAKLILKEGIEKLPKEFDILFKLMNNRNKLSKEERLRAEQSLLISAFRTLSTLLEAITEYTSLPERGEKSRLPIPVWEVYMDIFDQMRAEIRVYIAQEGA